MKRILSVWYWSLSFLPFTATLTLILTLIICIYTPNHARTHRLPQISELGTGQAYAVFATGFILLLPQVLVILLGRLQFLLNSQDHLPVWLLIIIHIIALLSGIFMLIMAIVNVEMNMSLHLTGAYGMFTLISVYLFVHTVVVLYLWKHRLTVPKHQRIDYFLYYVVCTFVLIVFFSIWVATAAALAEYFAASAPFLYFIGFVPQFWINRRHEQITEHSEV